jgi:hypothetical protein
MKDSFDGYRPTCKDCRKKQHKHPQPVQQYLFYPSKICTKCNKEKDLSEFNQMSKGKGGYHVHCRTCQSEYNHTYRLINLDEYKIRSHIKNIKPETKRRRMERHRERNINDFKYREIRKAARRRYYLGHRFEAQERVLKRKARILHATVGQVNIRHILKRDGYVCHICNKPIDQFAKPRSSAALSFDHVVPLQPRKGEPQGTHSEDNIKPAHFACNVRKSNRQLGSLTPYDRRGPI